MDLSSPQLDRGQGVTRESVMSVVAVYAKTALASQSEAQTHDAHVQACEARILRRRAAALYRGRALLSAFTVTPLPQQSLGLGQGIGLRVETTLRLRGPNGPRLRLYQDVFEFTSEAARIGLDTSSYIRPTATKTEQQLLSLLKQRALAHPL